MDRVFIEAPEIEITLLASLWTMASASHAFVDTGVLPGRAVVCRWSELLWTWRQQKPELAALQTARTTLASLAAREIQIEGTATHFLGEPVIDVQLLSRDAAGTEDVRLLINLSGYTPLILKDQRHCAHS